jgi:hypothetical protein
MADLGSLKVVGERLKDQRERVVILILMVILAWLSWNAWSMLQRQKTDEEGIRREILQEHGYEERGREQIGGEELDPEGIADRLVDIPPEDNLVRPLIEMDPLRPREDINEIKRQIGIMMEEASILMNQGKWADAIQVFLEILEIDPAGVKYDYREGTPRELLAVAEREQTRGRMGQAREKADEEYEAGKAELEQGNELKARDLLLQARRDYNQILDMDPERQILDEAFYATIDQRVEELTALTMDLVRDTLLQEIESNRQRAEDELAEYRQNPDDIGSLADAKGALIESLNYVDSVDPERNIAPASKVEEIEALLEEVDRLIVDVVPELEREAEEKIAGFDSEQDPQEKILKGEAALDALALLRGVKGDDPNLQQTQNRIERDLQQVRRFVAAGRAESILAEAEKHFEDAQDALRRGDMATAVSEKEAALAVLDELRTLREEDIREFLAEAEQLRREINIEIRSLPMVTGVVVDEIDRAGKWVRLSSSREGWSGRHFLDTFFPRTNITVTEIEPSPGAGNPYVVVTRPGYMETKLELEG